jgi:hypothetical protein
MLIRHRKPYLQNTQESPTEVSGTCAACGRSFHVYVRSTKTAALRRLQQSFNLHCRLRHKKIASSARPRSRAKQMINGTDSFANGI